MELDKIITGDSAVVLQSFPPDCIDLSIQSPPYDNLRSYEGQAEFDFETIARQLFRVTKQGGVCVWVVGDATENGSETLTSFKQALFFRECGFNVETMIYEVSGTGAKGSNKYYWQSFEYMFVLSKGQPKTTNLIRDKKNVKAGARISGSPKNESLGTRKSKGRENIIVSDFGIRQNIWRYHVGQNGGDITSHPAPFPERLAQDHIISWSNEGDIILDCFAGSGTTFSTMLRRRDWMEHEELIETVFRFPFLAQAYPVWLARRVAG